MQTQPEITKQELQQATGNALHILRKNARRYIFSFPCASSLNNRYHRCSNTDWTSGFCTGTYWLGYVCTQEPKFRRLAQRHVNSFSRRIRHNRHVDHHDMGFLYTLSCVAAYQLCGSQKGKESALLAAKKLRSRFREKGQFIQAWGKVDVKEDYRMIIDCLMNLPLLYWASAQTNDACYYDAAYAHLKTAQKYLFRPDASTYHTFFFDPENGAPLQGVTHQGYSNETTWARGQAWAIYGLALSYRHTQDVSCLKLCQRVVEYYLDHLPEDGVPYWDLSFSDGSTEPRDSSAAVIAACGLLELAEHMPQQQARYESLAKQMAASLEKGYAVHSPSQSNGLLLHGVYAKSSPHNPLQDGGVDECNLWGDYFWMELLVRLQGKWTSFW